MSLFGVVPFFKESRARGVKPIIGCELDTEGFLATGKSVPKDPFHLVVIAENREGYRNLLKLVTKALTRDDDHRGRVTTQEMSHHTKGLVALSGCPRCEIGCVLVRQGPRAAARVISQYAELFGKDNWFLEISRHRISEEDKLNDFLIAQAAAQKIPLVATNDVHYLEPQDAEAHDTLLAIRAGTNLDDPSLVRPGTHEFYLKSPAEMGISSKMFLMRCATRLSCHKGATQTSLLPVFIFPVSRCRQVTLPEAIFARSARRGLPGASRRRLFRRQKNVLSGNSRWFRTRDCPVTFSSCGIWCGSLARAASRSARAEARRWEASFRIASA